MISNPRNKICAKAARRTEVAVKLYVHKYNDGSLKKYILWPEYMLSTGQFFSALPGRIPNKYGREKDSQRYVGGNFL